MLNFCINPQQGAELGGKGIVLGLGSMGREGAKTDLWVWGLVLQVLAVPDLCLSVLVSCPPESAGTPPMVVLVPYLMRVPTLYPWVVLVPRLLGGLTLHHWVVLDLHPWVVPVHHHIGIPALHPLVVLAPYLPTALVLHPWVVSVSLFQGWSLSCTHSQS